MIIRAKKDVTRKEYYEYINKLNSEISDTEMKRIGSEFGTKRVDASQSEICRVVPGDWISAYKLLDMAKDNNILPEEAVKEVYKRLKAMMEKVDD